VSGIPAHGRYKPFEPGHLVTLAHGARSPRFVDPIAAELAKELLARRPDLAGYPEAVEAWSRAEARSMLYERFHAEVGAIDEDGNLRGGSHVHQVERQAQRMRERLGLDPLAEAELATRRADAVRMSANLEAVLARGRAIIERRRAELGIAVPSTTEDGSGAPGSARAPLEDGSR
jgi:hypothetical protein